MSGIIVIIFVLMFLGSACHCILVIKDYFYRRNMIKNAERNGNIDTVEAEVVDYIYRKSHSDVGAEGSIPARYHPIYEYMYNGEPRKYTSRSHKYEGEYPAGSKHTLYIDKFTGKVIDKVGISQLIGGIIFLVVSLFMLVDFLPRLFWCD